MTKRISDTVQDNVGTKKKSEPAPAPDGDADDEGDDGV